MSETTIPSEYRRNTTNLQAARRYMAEHLGELDAVGMNPSDAFLDELMASHPEAARGLLLLGLSYAALSEVADLRMVVVDRDLVHDDEPANSEEIH